MAANTYDAQLQHFVETFEEWGLGETTDRYDAMIDPIVSPWDTGPMAVVIIQAGGRYTTPGSIDDRPIARSLMTRKQRNKLRNWRNEQRNL